MTSPKDFRRQLDDVLSRRDPEALRAFLVASGQWQEDNTPKDLQAAMWMMIAGSPALARFHDEADAWLRSHGHETEAQAILGRRGGPGIGPPRERPQGQARPRGYQPKPNRGGGHAPGDLPRTGLGGPHGGRQRQNGQRPQPPGGGKRPDDRPLR
jgi:hypothetical protein